MARLLLVAVVAALAVAVGGSSATGAGGARLQVVARNLDNPRKLFVAPDGSVYVVLAGRGRDGCLTTCVGETASVVRVASGSVKPVITGLGSRSLPGGRDAEGAVDAIPSGSQYVVLMQDMEINTKGVNQVGLPYAGDLLVSPPGKLSAHVIADLAAYEAAHNPDHGAGPGPSYAQPSIDSDPYGVVQFRGGYAVIDAAGNDLLQVSPNGKVSLLAVFPTQAIRLTAAERRQHRPPAPPVLPVQSVPSALAVGPDGALYVGELTGWPYRIGSARIWRIAPGHKPTVFARGFTNISDLAFDGKDLLVLEITSKGIQNPASTGELIRLSPGGKRTILASKGLVFPTGVAVGKGWIYISNYGTYPGTGPAPHGELVRLRAS
jgi:hypothetical protein